MVVHNSKMKLLKVKGSEKLKMQQPTSLEAEPECSRRRKGSSTKSLEKKRYQKDDLVWVTSNRLVTEERRVSCSSLVNNESSPKEEMNLTIVSHSKGTKESHRQREKNAKVVGFKRMTKE